MKALIFIAILAVSASASDLKTLTKAITSIEKASGFDLSTTKKCFDEENSEVLMKNAIPILNYMISRDNSMILSI